MPAPPQLHTLTDRFQRNLHAYRSGHYNETQVRRDFIDPLLKLLGWDIDNEKGYAEQYREVVHEDAVKVSGSTKAPDYSLRIGGQRKLFVEAKKPSVNIKQDLAPAFQVRRYAWSAKLPLSILTDFEEFAVYDCRDKPDKKDAASHARIMYLTFEQYAEKWDELVELFSPQAIMQGAFDKFVDSSKKKRGTAEVDDAFLAEISTWRDALARNIALRNPGIKTRQLNHAVQRTIDRLIFLRIAEDRGIEPYGRLREATNQTNIYAELGRLFQLADAKYNSGLFHFKTERGWDEPPDTFTLGLTIDDKILRDIIKRLYYPDSPYQFDVIPADILGQVYEQFLGQVIRLTTKGQAKIEDKPEVKKAGGVFYTPTYIVDYIVQQTVGRLLQDKKPGPKGDASKLRILDPACGSGSFLLGAYQHLLDWHLTQYLATDPDKWARGKEPPLYQNDRGDWRLTIGERKRILLNNIYGVDIDPQAVEVTKLSLLLKVMEGENEQTLGTQLRLLPERVLPDLSANIQCGNSLIGPDFYDGQLSLGILDEEEMYRVNAFDWAKAFPRIVPWGGFDAIIGNPPYDVLEKDRGKSSWPHEALRDYISKRQDYQPALGGKLNLFRFFLIYSLELIKKNGHFGMILPLALLADISCSDSRKFLMQNSQDLLGDCFPQKDNPNKRVFFRAKLSTVIVTCKKQTELDLSAAMIRVRVFPANSLNDEFKENTITLEETKILDPDKTPIPLVDSVEWNLCKKIHTASGVKRLGTISEINVNRGEINQTVYRDFIVEDSSKTRLLKGVEIGQYVIREKLSQGKREWFDETRYIATSKSKEIAYIPRIATQRITGVDERLRIVATLVDPITYFADSTNSIYLSEESLYSYQYLLGLLNSKLWQWRFKLTSTNNNVGTNELESMPFRTINFGSDSDKTLHDDVTILAEQMLELHKRLATAQTAHEKTIIQRQIAATDRHIDQLVYQLYNLTPEEIAIVEGS